MIEWTSLNSERKQLKQHGALKVTSVSEKFIIFN